VVVVPVVVVVVVYELKVILPPTPIHGLAVVVVVV
jgi:hypothetical protein